MGNWRAIKKEANFNRLGLPAPPPGRRRQKLYKTGDIGYFREDGNIECLGRMDSQVKIRGNRIELGEIESQLLTHSRVKEAAVTLVPIAGADGASGQICAYYVPEKEVDEAGLRDYLSGKLPDYMIPVYFTALEKLPLTSNGKVDRKALPVPGARPAGEEYIAPADETEKRLARIWARILGREESQISALHHFFELGGHSLSAITLISEIYNEFGVELPIASVFKAPVLREAAEQIKTCARVEEPVLLLSSGPGASSSRGTLFCFPPGIGFGLSYQELTFILTDYLVYSFNFIEEEDRLRRYTEIITGIQPGGPYLFFGYSAAGPLMMEVAKQLENNGVEVSDIIFLDCIFAEKGSGQTVKPINQRLVSQVAETLNEMGVGFLKDRVVKKIEKYMVYEAGKTDLEVVDARIHLILSQETEDSPLSRCWDKFSSKKSLLYRGFGRHSQMLSPGFLERNAQVIREILDTLEADSG